MIQELSYSLKLALQFLLMNCILFTIEAHEWSTPDKIIYPTNPTSRVSGCSLACNHDGYCVAVWFDPTQNGALYGAKLAPGSLDSLNRPNWIITPAVTTSSVQVPSSTRVKSVGIDLAGNAVATWTDGNNNVFVSTLPQEQNRWTEPHIINIPTTDEIVSSPSIAVASDGNTIVTWTVSTEPNSRRVLANVYDARAEIWKGQQEVLGTGIAVEAEISAMDIDVCGNAILVISSSEYGVQAIAYDFFSSTWTPITPLSIESSALCNIAMDTYGNAIVAWVQGNETVHAALLSKNATAFHSEMILSTSANASIFPAIALAQNGDAVIAWSDLSGNLGSARFTRSSLRWEKLNTLSVSRKQPTNIELAIDFQGNAAAIWTLNAHGARYVQTAQLQYKSISWKRLSILGSKTEIASNAHLIKTSQGNAVVIWQNNFAYNDNQSVLKSSMKLGAILPPLHFQGKVVKKYSAGKSNRIHCFTWVASPDPTVVKYQLYANEKLVDSISNKQRVFQYNLPNRSRSKLIDYTLVAIDNRGNKSEPQIVKLP